MNYLISEATKSKLERIIDKVPGEEGTHSTPTQQGRYVSYVRVTGSPTSGVYPCKPTVYNRSTATWTDYDDALVIDGNGLSLNSGERYLAMRYGVDSSGKFVFVVETSLALKFARDAGWGADFTYRRWVLNGYTFAGVAGYPGGNYAILNPEYCDGTVPRDGIVGTGDQHLGKGTKYVGTIDSSLQTFKSIDTPPSPAAFQTVGIHAENFDVGYRYANTIKYEVCTYGTIYDGAARFRLIREPISATMPKARIELDSEYLLGQPAYCCRDYTNFPGFGEMRKGITGHGAAGDTFCGGLMVEAGDAGATGTDQAGNTVSNGRIMAIATDGASGTNRAGDTVTNGRITALGSDGASGTDALGNSFASGRLTTLGAGGWSGSFTVVDSVDFGTETTTTKTVTVVAGIITDVS